MPPSHQLAFCPLYTAILLAISSPAFSASFTIEDGETVTSRQSLYNNQTGTIETGGTLSTSTTAISADGDNITIQNNGSIMTSGMFGYGIYSQGSNANINNSGSIATSSEETYGIRSIGADAMINNSGSISTSGDFAQAIYSTGSNVKINNSGSITTGGEGTNGIMSAGSNAIINNSGSISTNGDDANGIYSEGSNATINNSGTIMTSGRWGYGIASSGSNATINNSGSITTSGDYSHGLVLVSTATNAIIHNSGSISTSARESFGIYSSADNSTVINSGSITTTNDFAYGIYSAGSNTSINNGSIITSGSNSHGIYAQESDATIINNGSILTTGDPADGIRALGDNVIIYNLGSISVSGESYGISSSGDNADIFNAGTITTLDEYSFAIRSSGNSANIINNGSIKTSGAGSQAFYSTGANANMVNDGLIHTTGDSAVGIFSTGDNATFTNYGVVSTEGDYSFAVRVSRANANITNNGLISTSGGIGYGILASGLDATITNTGTIQTTGEAAIGIRTTTTNATIHNSGAVSTTGADSHAITIVGRDSTINNSGLISATGEGAYAILGESNAQDLTLNLLTGSQIIGRIDLGGAGDNDTANVYAGGMSSQLTFENTENINVFGNGVLNGNTVTTVDATGESARSVALSGMTSSIHGVINQRMNHAAPLKPVQLASLELSDGMYFEEQRPVAWSQVFGGTMDRDATGSAMAYGYDHAGINFGYEWDMAGHRVGVLGGLVRGKTESELASFETESDNYYVGAYANRKAYGLNITGSLLAGYGDNDNDRLVVDNLNGFETASADFSSWFISPGISIGSAFDIADRLEFRPSVSVNYSIAWLDSYTEKGTTNANLSVDDHKLQALTARAQLAAAYQLSDTSEFELRAGVNSRHTNDDDTKVGIAGSQFRFANAGDESVTGGFAGAALRVMNDNNFTLIADVEFGGNSDEDYAAGSLTLQYAF